MSVGWRLEFTGGPVDPPSNFHPMVDAWADIEPRERALNLTPGTPILVRPEGDLDFRLVEYFTRSLEFTGLATTSKATYGGEMRGWFDFIRDSEGIDWDEASSQTFVAFRTFRMHTGDDENRVSPATFAKSVPALRGFYTWAVNHRYIDESPIPVTQLSDSPGAQPKNKRASRDKWILPRTYGLWRNVGLLDCSATYDAEALEVKAASARSAAARGRNQLRNIAYTDLLLTSALRNRELAHVLVSELPTTSTDEVMLPSTTAKGGRERSWMSLSPYPLQAVDRYVRTVRRAQVLIARAHGGYEGREWIIATDLNPSSGTLRMADSGQRRSLDSLTVEERPRLLIDTSGELEPLMLWLNESGVPMGHRSWGNVFTKANQRLAGEYRRLGIRSAPPRISAHSLRFTCALFTLLSFVQVIDQRLGIDPLEPWVEARYAEAFDFVKDMLGHADEGTTKGTYLKPLRDLRRMDALGQDRTLPNLMEWLAQESALVTSPGVQA